MKGRKIGLTGLVFVVALMVSLVALMATPAMAVEPVNVLHFDPDEVSVPECCQSVKVDLVAEIDPANPVTFTLMTFTFDNTCLEITEAVGNAADWLITTIPELGPVNTNGSMTISTSVGLAPGKIGSVPIATLTLHCINCDGCIALLDLTEGEYTLETGETLYPDLDDGTFRCEEPPPCPPEGERVVVSGYYTGDLFVPTDEIAPGQDLAIEGSGFPPSTQYNVWVVPYAEGVQVGVGQALAGLGGPGLVATVSSCPEGYIAGQPIYTIPVQDPGMPVCSFWEIVVDNGDDVYLPADDGLDACALDAWGFHVWPEALTIVLLSVGLVGLGGYYGLRRRKGSDIDA